MQQDNIPSINERSIILCALRTLSVIERFERAKHTHVQLRRHTTKIFLVPMTEVAHLSETWTHRTVIAGLHALWECCTCKITGVLDNGQSSVEVAISSAMSEQRKISLTSQRSMETKDLTRTSGRLKVDLREGDR